MYKCTNLKMYKCTNVKKGTNEKQVKSFTISTAEYKFKMVRNEKKGIADYLGQICILDTNLVFAAASHIIAQHS